MRRHKFEMEWTTLAIILLTIKVMCTASIIIPWNEWMDNTCNVVAVAIVGYKILKSSFTKRQVIVLSLMSLLIIYTCIAVRQYDLFISWITILLLKDEDLNKHIRLIMQIETVFIILHIIIGSFCSAIGFFENFWSYTGTRLRFNGGFGHANVLATFILSCLLMYVWLRYEELKNEDLKLEILCVIVVVSLFSFVMTKSRTALMLSVLLLALTCLSMYIPMQESAVIQRVFQKIAMFGFPALSLFMMIACKRYLDGGVIVSWIDELVTGRIKYGAYALSHSGLTFLPTYIDYADKGVIPWEAEWELTTFTFDNLYTFMFAEYGILWIVITSVWIYLYAKRSTFKEQMFIVVSMFFAVTEVHGLNGYKFFPILLFAVLFQVEEKRT